MATTTSFYLFDIPLHTVLYVEEPEDDRGEFGVMPKSSRPASTAPPHILFCFTVSRSYLGVRSPAELNVTTLRYYSKINRPTSELIHRHITRQKYNKIVVNLLSFHSGILVSIRVPSSHTTWEGAAGPSSHLRVSCTYFSRSTHDRFSNPFECPLNTERYETP